MCARDEVAEVGSKSGRESGGKDAIEEGQKMTSIGKQMS